MDSCSGAIQQRSQVAVLVCIFLLFFLPDAVSMLAHTFSHKPLRKI